MIIGKIIHDMRNTIQENSKDKKAQILFDLRVTQPMLGEKRHGGGKNGEVILCLILER